MKIKIRSLITGRRGFSVGEMLVGGMIVAFVFGVGIKYFGVKKKDLKQTQKRIEKIVTGLIFEQYLGQDIRGMDNSYRSLKLIDDNGRNFYDHIFDQVCSQNCLRTFTLEPGGRPFIMLTSNRLIPALNYSPASAYSLDGTSGPYLNRNNILVKAAAERGIPSMWPKVDNEYSLIFMGSDIPVRKNLNDHPAFISFLGWAKGGSREMTRETVGGLANIKDPRDNRNITSLDTAFRRVPHTEGLGNSVRLTAQKIVRYRMEWDQKGSKKQGVVFRGIKTGPEKEAYEESLIGIGFEKVTFTRQSIQRPSVYAEIILQKK